jgi:hypothetical protein
MVYYPKNLTAKFCFNTVMILNKNTQAHQRHKITAQLAFNMPQRASNIKIIPD